MLSIINAFLNFSNISFQKNKKIVFIYLFNASILLNIWNGFHIDVLAIPVICLLIKSFEKNNKYYYFFLTLILCSIKETYCFTAIIAGVIFYKKDLKISISIIFVSLSYFLLAYFYLIPLNSNNFYFLSSNNKNFVFNFYVIINLIFIFIPFINSINIRNIFLILTLPSIFLSFFSQSTLLINSHYLIILMPIFYYLINDEINKKYILRFSLSFLLFPILLIYYSLENYSNIKVKDYINFNNEVTKYVNKNDIKNSYLFIQNNININFIKNFKDFELINKNFKLPIDLKLNGYIIINSNNELG